MERLRRRREFLAAARSASWATSGAVVQFRRRDDDAPARVGFTVTRKLGGSVARNRIRRRLREAVRVGLEGRLRAGHDYVVIGRAASATRPFPLLISDLADAVEKLHMGKAGRRGPRPDHASGRASGDAREA